MTSICPLCLYLKTFKHFTSLWWQITNRELEHGDLSFLIHPRPLWGKWLFPPKSFVNHFKWPCLLFRPQALSDRFLTIWRQTTDCCKQSYPRHLGVASSNKNSKTEMARGWQTLAARERAGLGGQWGKQASSLTSIYGNLYYAASIAI